MNEIIQPAPDPSWHYYQTWHDLIEAKNNIEQALMLLLLQQEASKDCDEQINQFLSKTYSALERIGALLPDEPI